MHAGACGLNITCAGVAQPARPSDYSVHAVSFIEKSHKVWVLYFLNAWLLNLNCQFFRLASLVKRQFFVLVTSFTLKLYLIPLLLRGSLPVDVGVHDFTTLHTQIKLNEVLLL